MSPPRPRAHARRGIALAAAVLAAGFGPGCAPHRVAPPALTLEGRAAAFRAALAAREARGRAVDAEVTLWARLPGARTWPAVGAALALRAPDGLRLRVASLFGTAFDGAARGDSVMAVLPARRLGFTADARRDSLGIGRPGRLGYRTLTATWRPPDEAWRAAEASADTLVLRWTEEGDSLRLEIGPDGQPLAITMAHAGSPRVRASYRSWQRHAGVAWPSSIELKGGEDAVTLRCRVERLRFRSRPEAERPLARLPDGVVALAWPAFRRALEREPEGQP